MPGTFAIAGGPPPPSVTWTDAEASNTILGTHTFTAVAIGTAGTRHIIFPVITGATVTSCSATVNGSAATAISGATLNGSAWDVRMFIASVPTGTTADIVVTISPSSTCFITAFAAYDLTSAASFDTATDQGTDPLTLSLNIPANGIAVAMSFVNDSPNSWTWTGMTERADAIYTSTSLSYTAATYVSGVAVTPLSVTANYTGIGSPIGVSASFN